MSTRRIYPGERSPLLRSDTGQPKFKRLKPGLFLGCLILTSSYVLSHAAASKAPRELVGVPFYVLAVNNDPTLCKALLDVYNKVEALPVSGSKLGIGETADAPVPVVWEDVFKRVFHQAGFTEPAGLPPSDDADIGEADQLVTIPDFYGDAAGTLYLASLTEGAHPANALFILNKGQGLAKQTEKEPPLGLSLEYIPGSLINFVVDFYHPLGAPLTKINSKVTRVGALGSEGYKFKTWVEGEAFNYGPLRVATPSVPDASMNIQHIFTFAGTTFAVARRSALPRSVNFDFWKQQSVLLAFTPLADASLKERCILWHPAL